MLKLTTLEVHPDDGIVEMAPRAVALMAGYLAIIAEEAEEAEDAT